MLKKIIIGILLVSVIGATGTALAYNAVNQENDGETTVIEPLASAQGYNANSQQTSQGGQNGSSSAAENQAGVPWQETGTITGLDDYGFQFKQQNGEIVYIELGPPDFWRNQGVELQVGQSITVKGSNNEGMIHAEQITLADGQTLQLRTENGQPMWSGGEISDRGQTSGQADGEHVPDPQAQVDEWITLSGELLAFQGSNMTMSTTDGEIVAFQTGQPRFFSDQGITFQVGDEITVVGYYEGEQVMVGDITQVSTGLRVILRDPNGRPLWGGPGSGQGNQGSSGSGRGKH